MCEALYIRIKKQYAADLIEDLIKVEAVEAVEEVSVELTALQRTALDKELHAIESNPGYLLKWNDIKHRYEKP